MNEVVKKGVVVIDVEIGEEFQKIEVQVMV